MSGWATPRDSSQRGVFGHADERPYRRLTGDWVRLVLAAVVVAISTANPQFLQAAERTLDAFFATLPGSLDGVFEIALAVGYLWGLALVVIAALVARRFRLATVIAAGGLLARFLARFLGFAVGGAGTWSSVGKAFGTDDPGSYPTVRLAVLAAVVLVASPFLTRPVRRLGQLVLLVLAPGMMVLGLGGIDAVVGALALGWGVAAILHLALGSPAGPSDHGPGGGRAGRARRRHHVGRPHPRAAGRFHPRDRVASRPRTAARPGVRARRGRHPPRGEGVAVPRVQGLGADAHPHAACSRSSTRRCACTRRATRVRTCR